MEILLSVAAKIAEYAVEPILRPVGYLFSYKDNFNKLEVQVKDLEVARAGIIELVEAEKRNGKQVVTDVLNWQHEVNDITDKAKKLCEHPCRAKVGCSRWSCPNLWWRQKLSRKAERVAKDVADVQRKGKFGTIGYLPALSGVGSISSTRHIVNFESRMSIIKEITGALADQNVSMLGVFGLGGVGKSTLVEHVARKVKDEKLFETVVMAAATEIPNLERIHHEIADQLGLKFSDKSERVRSQRLRERIKNERSERSILIILDDIPETIALEKLGIPYQAKINSEKERTVSGNDDKVCKVLLTSRNQDVLHRMGTQKDFRLEALSEEETWSLFEVMACDAAKNPSLRHTATEVARKCAGLPVLIVTLARALNNKGIHAWKEALNDLERVDNKELREITHSALELSYKCLGNDEVKALFLLCGLVGPHIRVEYLLKCVMGLGLFKHIRTLEDARNRLYNMIDSLKASCLLLEGDTGVEVKMHDIIHGVAVSIASRDQHIFMIRKDTELKEWPKKDFLKRYRQIILDCCHIHQLPERLDCPELKCFCLYSSNISLGIPDSFFEGMPNINMLDLTFMKLSSLPTSFGSLINLKTLCLDLCALGDMAAIAPLRNIEILSLYQSSMTKLPNEIGQLTNLRMLDLSNSEIKFIPPNIISSLTKLEELYMGNTFIEWEVEDLSRKNKNASLAELRHLPNLTALDLQIQEARILPKDLMFEKLERYTILIGDIWEWFGNYKTSKVLKLKLCASIHLEHGIKTLIERVEELYLDQIYGISNVLYQLNVEGFPLLKHLHIQNNAKIQHIVNSLEWNQARDSFPKLETLVLSNLCNLGMICCGPLAINSFNKLRVIKVESCYKLAYLFSYSMINVFRELLEIDVSKCNSMKKIVLAESGIVVGNGLATDKIEFCRLYSLTLHNLPALDDFCSDGLTAYDSLPFFSTQVAFPNLKTLKLSSIGLNKIWDDNKLLVVCSFQNLTNLIVEDCGDLKYLFSSSMVESLLNLKRLEISRCHMMKEIIDTKEERNSGSASEEVRFSKLETIIINDMKNLKKVWHYQFDKLRSLEVKKCEKVVIVFPSYMQRKFHILETLVVTDCGSVEEIFELNANEMCSEKKMTQLKELTLLQLPKLKRIWSRDPQGILCYHNLLVVHVEKCRNLEFLFPLSIATNLWQLEKIIIKEAEGMKEIVANREGPMDGNAVFVFNRLSSLVLWSLFKLEMFYAGDHTLACPSLKEVFVFGCTKLRLFKTQSTSNQGPTPDNKLCVSSQQSLFTVEEVIPNLEQLTLNNKDARILFQGQFSGYLLSKLKLLRLYDFDEEEAAFPYWFLKNVPNLAWLIVDYSFFNEIFQDKRFLGEEGPVKISTRLKRLTLVELHGLQHICKEGSKIDPILEVIEYIIVKKCVDLISLVPSSNSFSHLTYLEVEKCNKLIYLITSPTARSLAKLKVMKIKDCNSLEEIVREKGNETEDNSSFCSLETLELNCLPRLTRFCSSKCYMKLQMLEEVVVRQCPRMQVFSEGNTSTPSLHKVQIEDDQEGCWEGNLNGTIKKMFMNMVAFHSFQHLNLFEYPELKDLWYGQHKMFSNLKYLVVQKCNSLSDILFSSNLLEAVPRLEELEIRDCDLLEAVFDLPSMNDNRILVKEITQLKKLTLYNAPNLKHIWKNSSHEILSFGNLCLVNVVECPSLTNLFTVSLCQNLRLLEELNVRSCGVEEIVAMDEGSEEHCFDFPQLTIMKLWNLTKLKSFYPGGHTLNCPSLKKLSVYHCDTLRIFEFDLSNFRQPHPLGGVDIPTQKALFSVENVCPHLELLTLNERDAMTIWNGQYPASLFSKVDLLSLQCFHQTPATFPNDLIQRFVNLVTLQVRCSSFEVLFPSEEIGHISTAISMRIKNLYLFTLNELKYIWPKDSQRDALDLKLEHLVIMDCSGLENLVPSSISLKNLTTLSVDECKGLIHLITFSTAKTLVRLTSLTINSCEMIEDVIHIEEEAEEIIFKSLEELQLTSLPSLKSFSRGKQAFKFPSLVSLTVIGCPNMEIFSPGIIMAPMLRAVKVENGKERWRDDLNATVKHCL